MLFLSSVTLIGSSDTWAQDGKGKPKPKPKANDGIITDWSKPKGFAAGKVTSYWVWHEDDVWHFRTTGGGKGAHQFVGKIEVIGGSLINLKGKKGEYGGKLVD